MCDWYSVVTVTECSCNTCARPWYHDTTFISSLTHSSWSGLQWIRSLSQEHRFVLDARYGYVLIWYVFNKVSDFNFLFMSEHADALQSFCITHAHTPTHSERERESADVHLSPWSSLTHSLTRCCGRHFSSSALSLSSYLTNKQTDTHMQDLQNTNFQ